MTQMATSGARGNLAQLMKIVGTPLAAQTQKGINPFVIQHSYAEGLTPAEYWVTTPEARNNAVEVQLSTAQPGEMTKILVANMINKVVARKDCGTHAGVRLAIDDANAVDRHLAGDQHGYAHNTLVIPALVSGLRAKGATWLLVRSPMTCAESHGVCQMCWGISEKGQLHPIGMNVGTRSAQAISEPLTQMVLSSKHAVLMIKPRTAVPRGFKGVRQVLEIPKIFQGEAVLAPSATIVESIEPAPQGGHYLHLRGVSKPLYATTQLNVLVKPGDHVEAGDALTDGLPRPDAIVAHKGLGAGRQYFADTLHQMYLGDGLNMDKRHFELLAKSELNHVRLTEPDPDHPELLKGDILAYNSFADAYRGDVKELPVAQAVGSRLGREAHHHTVGTLITPRLAEDLTRHGVTTVGVAPRLPQVEFVMKPFAQNPLLDPDWLGRMAHRYLKGSIQQAAQTGQDADIHGTHPVPAYAYGAELERGPDGTY
jgi:DNA-directed RNA polymerase subunit beta'